MVSQTKGLICEMFRLLDDGVHELLPLDACTSARGRRAAVVVPSGSSSWTLLLSGSSTCRAWCSAGNNFPTRANSAVPAPPRPKRPSAPPAYGGRTRHRRRRKGRSRGARPGRIYRCGGMSCRPPRRSGARRSNAARIAPKDRTVIPVKWTSTDAADGSSVMLSLRGGWGNDIRARAILAGGVHLSFALAASSTSTAASSSSSSSSGPTHSEDSLVVSCARRGVDERS